MCSASHWSRLSMKCQLILGKNNHAKTITLFLYIKPSDSASHELLDDTRN